MKHRRIGGASLLLLLAGGSDCSLAAPRPPPPAPPPAVPAALAAKVKLELLTRATTEAVALVAAPGEPVGRLFVVEKRGPIRLLRGKKIDPTPFLDLTGKVSLEPRDNGERGLLGLAFHPHYRENGRFYLNFTEPRGDTRIVEMKVDRKNPDRAEPGSARVLLAVAQPYANHNGGDLAFGPDGKLYVLLGDGGDANDPHGNGQNPRTMLAKALRLDVDAEKPAAEIVARGLRNPWRYSFDRKTGDLYIADVGQSLWEYVHVVPTGTLAGRNFGWNVTEGKHCFRGKSCDQAGLTPPVLEYAHSEGCSISGGHVYRGKALPELEGLYFFSDYCTAILRSFRWKDGQVADSWDWKAALDPDFALARVSAFGQDQDGELYLVTHEGPLYKLVRR
jgi:glucose/arabinose dehydrogenase